jgi:molecular chaperone DnaK (HSP70)
MKSQRSYRNYADTESTKDILFIDVTPLSLGLETDGGVMTKIIERGTVIPAKKTMTLTTYHDDQQTAVFSIYEGERALVQDNFNLGDWKLTNLLPGDRSESEIEVTFEVDENSVLIITTLEKKTGNSEQIVIQPDSENRPTRDQIEQMIDEAENFKDHDKAIRERFYY